MDFEIHDGDFEIGDNVIFNKDKCWKEKHDEYPCIIVGQEYEGHYLLYMDKRFDDGISGCVSGAKYSDDGFTFISYCGFFKPAENIKFDFKPDVLAELL